MTPDENLAAEARAACERLTEAEAARFAAALARLGLDVDQLVHLGLDLDQLVDLAHRRRMAHPSRWEPPCCVSRPRPPTRRHRRPRRP